MEDVYTNVGDVLTGVGTVEGLVGAACGQPVVWIREKKKPR